MLDAAWIQWECSVVMEALPDALTVTRVEAVAWVLAVVAGARSCCRYGLHGSALASDGYIPL